MLLFLYIRCGIRLLQGRVLVPINYWGLWIMFKNLSGLPWLAQSQKNRIGNVLPFSTRSPRFFSFWDGRHQKKNREKIPRVLAPPFYRSLIDTLLTYEQSNACWSHDSFSSRHEWHLDGRMQSSFGNEILIKHSKHHWVCFITRSLDLLQDFCLPILLVSKRLCECATSNWWMVHDRFRI